jgi:Mg-chelatase subunit ChlD
MSELVAALEEPKQIGENGHTEYAWSNDVKERIIQFHFQVTRADEAGVSKLSETLSKLLFELRRNIGVGEKESVELLSLLYCMIGYTRDMIDGKGEFTLAYMMVYEWYKFYPELALFALDCFVDLGDPKMHPYGSWKDFKYFCKYCRSRGDMITTSPLIQHCIGRMNRQLRVDHESIKNIHNNNDDVKLTLVAKWIPREKSSFGWLYEALATDYFKQYMDTVRGEYGDGFGSSKSRAILKCKTQYREILSSLNKRIDTLQIKQCGKTWREIDFEKGVTSVSMVKQRKAFLNVDSGNPKKSRYPESEDRVECAENFKEFVAKAARKEVVVKGKRVSMADFTAQAIDISNSNHALETTQIERAALNAQWENNSLETGPLGKMVAMVDVSGSMEGDPIKVAVALGIRIAEKSAIGKRVMTFSKEPRWVNLEGQDFVGQVATVMRSDWGTNTNFYAALDMILAVIQWNQLSQEEASDMVLVILSDMQIDEADSDPFNPTSGKRDALYAVMEKKYAKAGIAICGVPYKPPHILFWNLRSLPGGFPSLSSQPNTSMMSGFSPALLNLFCEKGVDALRGMTPFHNLVQCLENERYSILKERFFEE